MLMGFLNCAIFYIVHALLPGTSKAFTLSVFLQGAHVYVVLPGTQRYIRHSKYLGGCLWKCNYLHASMKWTYMYLCWHQNPLVSLKAHETQFPLRAVVTQTELENINLI